MDLNGDNTVEDGTEKINSKENYIDFDFI